MLQFAAGRGARYRLGTAIERANCLPAYTGEAGTPTLTIEQLTALNSK